MTILATDIDFAEKGYNANSQQCSTDVGLALSLAGRKSYQNVNGQNDTLSTPSLYGSNTGIEHNSPESSHSVQYQSFGTATNISDGAKNEIMAKTSMKTEYSVDATRKEKTNLSQVEYPKTTSRDFVTYPLGFPRLAAFQNSSSDLAIFRRFGVAHCRLLTHLQCEITNIIKELEALDISDSKENSGMLYRLRRNEWHQGWDTAQKDLLEKLQGKLVVYDDLLLKDRNLRCLESPKTRHYKSLFNWILGHKPLDGGQYDFLFDRGDFVSTIKSNHDSRFDDMIEWVLACRPGSKLFQKIVGESTKARRTLGSEVYTFSRVKVAILAKVLALTVAFMILIIPILLLYLAEMSDGARAGLILVFVPAFAILMSLFLKARVEAVFIGTCTYCAVLVTFLGNVGVRDGVCNGCTV